MKKMNSTARFLVINAIILLVLALGAGYLGYRLGISQKETTIAPIKTSQFKIGPDSIIKTQGATAQGTIVAADDQNVTVKGDDGSIMVFKLSPSFTVAANQATSSAGLVQNSHHIRTNEKAILSLSFDGDGYKVVSILYPPSAH